MKKIEDQDDRTPKALNTGRSALQTLKRAVQSFVECLARGFSHISRFLRRSAFLARCFDTIARSKKIMGDKVSLFFARFPIIQRMNKKMSKYISKGDMAFITAGYAFPFIGTGPSAVFIVSCKIAYRSIRNAMLRRSGSIEPPRDA